MNKEAKAVGDNSVDMCAACDIDLATCDIIWAAEGTLYCCKECGIEDYKYKYGNAAERYFNDVAEEVTPKDIGITCEETSTAYSTDTDTTTIFKEVSRRSNNTLVSTEVIGFYFGKPNKKDTERFAGSLKAVY